MKKLLAILAASALVSGSALAQTPPTDLAMGGMTTGMVAATVAVVAVAAAASNSSDNASPASPPTTTTTTTTTK